MSRASLLFESVGISLSGCTVREKRRLEELFTTIACGTLSSEPSRAKRAAALLAAIYANGGHSAVIAQSLIDRLKEGP